MEITKQPPRGRKILMTLMTAPVPATTSSGAPLPLVALPQGELLTVNEKNIPMVRDVLGPGVHVQPLRLDIENGEWVVLATFEPGATVPLHYHTGVAEVYTLSGAWHYLEYPEQLQTAGSYLYEPGSSVHTFITPQTNTELTVILVRVVGANINFSEDGQFHSILDAALIRHVTDARAVEQNLGPVNYIGGGAAGYMAGQS
jgi:quercetin dioxygenase-like cupin family protein